MKLYSIAFPTLTVEKSSDKVIAKLPAHLRRRVLDVIEALAINPKPLEAGSFKRLNPPVDVLSMTAHYRLRVANYRILYDVDESQKIVWILALRKRNELTYK